MRGAGYSDRTERATISSGRIAVRLRALEARVRLSFSFLGYFLAMSERYPACNSPQIRALCWCSLLVLVARPVRPQPSRPTDSAEASHRAAARRHSKRTSSAQVGKIFYADGHVDVRYQNARLRADHVEYDSEAQVVLAHGNVQLDYLTQHVEADERATNCAPAAERFTMSAARSPCSAGLCPRC